VRRAIALLKRDALQQYGEAYRHFFGGPKIRTSCQNDMCISSINNKLCAIKEEKALLAAALPDPKNPP
jgi:hypothetical protein